MQLRALLDSRSVSATDPPVGDGTRPFPSLALGPERESTMSDIRCKWNPSTGKVNLYDGERVVVGGISGVRMMLCVLRGGWLGSFATRPILAPIHYGPKRK